MLSTKEIKGEVPNQKQQGAIRDVILAGNLADSKSSNLGKLDKPTQKISTAMLERTRQILLDCARKEAATENMFWELHKMHDRLMDQAIAERTGSPNLLRKLSYSKYPEVRYEVGGNEATPNSVRWELLKDNEWTVLYALAGATKSQEMLEILLKNPEMRVAGRAARNENLSDTRLCLMVGDEEETYSEWAAKEQYDQNLVRDARLNPKFHSEDLRA